MQPHAEDEASDEIEQRLTAEEVIDSQIGGHLHNDVGHLHHGERLRTHEHGAKEVGERQHHQPGDLAEGGAEEASLDLGRQVHVQSVRALVPVVLHVVLLVGHRQRHAHRQVGEDAEGLVGERVVVAEGEVVRQLVDRQHQ